MIYTGSGVAMVTPFVENTGDIDWEAFDNLIEFHIENKTDALIICGTTGESATMTDEEQVQVIKRAVKVVDGRIPVIGGAGVNDTRHSIHLAEEVEEVGADGLLVVTPYYNKANEEGLKRHFLVIADSVNTPIILYNVPGRTGMTIKPKLVQELAEHPNIVALKDAVGDIEYTKDVLRLVPDDFAVYSGNDDLTHEVIKAGGHGTISVTANVIPQEVHEMCKLTLEGNYADGAKLDLKWANLTDLCFVEVNPIPVKYLVHKLGRCANSYRLPLCEPSEAAQKQLDELLPSISKYKA